MEKDIFRAELVKRYKEACREQKLINQRVTELYILLTKYDEQNSKNTSIPEDDDELF